MSIDGRWQRILICAAHPDDESMGAGGTIARLTTSGTEAMLAVFTSAHPPLWPNEVIQKKRLEALAAATELGIGEVRFFDFPAARLDTLPQQDLNDRLRDLVSEFQPTTVLTTHYGDVHSDHRIVFETTLVATRPLPGASVRQVLAFECLSSTEWSAPAEAYAFLPHLYVDIEATLETKIKALGAYASEMKAFPHPRSPEAVRAQAAKRGSEVGVPAAEAFQVVREVL